MSLYSAARARRALFYTIGFRVVSQAATILSFVVLVRGLSEQSLGVYSLLYSVLPVIGTVASLGLDQVLKRFLPEYLQAGNQAGAAWLVRVIVRLRLVTNLVLLGLILLTWNLVAPVFHLQDHRADFEVFGLVALLYFQVIILQSALAAHMLHNYSVGSVAVLSIGKLLAYLAVSHFFEFSLRAAIVADLAAYAGAWLVLAIAHHLRCRAPQDVPPYNAAPDEKRRLKRYAVANNFNESSSLLLYVQTDNFFIAAMMNAVAVGAYSFYARINEMAMNLVPIRLFENVVQPMLFATRKEVAAERLPRYFTFLVNISMLVQWPLIAFSLVYHHELIQLVFGGKFIEYSPLLPVVFAFAWTNNVFSTPVTMIALYGENPSLILKSQLFGLYQVAAMLVLVPVLGLYGAAIATGTLHLFRNIWVWWHVRETARWLNFWPAMIAGFTVWGLAVVACLGIKYFVPLPPLAQLVAGAVVCAGAGLIYVRGPAFATSDRQILGGVLHGKEATLLRWIGLLPRAEGKAA